MEALHERHDRTNFTCGVPALDGHLQKQARQDAARSLTAVTVLSKDGIAVSGFYTLSASLLTAEGLQLDDSRKLPQRPVPAILIGRLAVAVEMRGQGVGEFLLFHALGQILEISHNIGSWAAAVDAKDGAREFYLAYGFRSFLSEPNRLYLPTKVIRSLLQEQQKD